MKKKIEIRIELLSDTIFGSGVSVPGGEDLTIQYDENGFPFLKGSTFKGIFKEEYINYLNWISNTDIDKKIYKLFGESSLNCKVDCHDGFRLIFTDFCLSKNVKNCILSSTNINKQIILESLTNIRTFTRIDDNNISKRGSLRSIRCINKGISFYGAILIDDQFEKEVIEVLKCIKWIGTMRTRGFGSVRLHTVGGED